MDDTGHAITATNNTDRDNLLMVFHPFKVKRCGLIARGLITCKSFTNLLSRPKSSTN